LGDAQGLESSEAKMKKKEKRCVRVRSERSYSGLPLYDIAYGPDSEMGEKHGKARGIIAIGDEARGWLALGGDARGVVALGGKAMGIIALGGISVGVIALGGLALGAVALGGLAAGGIAVGGKAMGLLAVDKERGRKGGE
jgi:hypothetical protein